MRILRFAIVSLKSLGVDNKYCWDIKNGVSQDITNHNVQDEIADVSETVIHLAAVSGIKPCNENAYKAERLNADATLELASACSRSGSVKKFIFASSSAVYGEAENYLIDESHECHPRSLYGETKLKAEDCIDYQYGEFEVVVLRKSNIYGFGQFWKGSTVIDKFIDCYLYQKPFIISGDGTQKRDFVHLMDVVRLYKDIALMPRVRTGIYNVGGPESVSINRIADMVNEIGASVFGYRVDVQHSKGSDEAAWHDFIYDSMKARMEFQFIPRFRIQDYLKERMLFHLRDNQRGITGSA